MPMRSLRVRDYMTPRKRLKTVTPDTNVVEAMTMLLETKVSGAPVVDDSGKLLGVLSEVDLLKVVEQDSYYDEGVGLAGDYMHAPAETVSDTMDIYALTELFLKDRRRRYPVVDEDGQLVGQISRRDVLRAMQEFLVKAHA